MAQNPDKKFQGPNHLGPARSSPYPVSRLAPAHDLVHVAQQIQEADAMLGATTQSQLNLIAAQIRSLQNMARDILETAARDAELHRATCNFQRKPGHVYHLYKRQTGEPFFSLIGPQEWGGTPPHIFVGSYRLEENMSWTET